MVNRWRKTGKYYWVRPRGKGLDELQIYWFTPPPYKIMYKMAGSYWSVVGKGRTIKEAEKIASDFRRNVS